jgi:hypothetical protein
LNNCLLLFNQDFYINAITGEIDIDDSWERYINDLYSNGLGEAFDIISMLPGGTP